MKKTKILITGANGQLGRCLYDLFINYHELECRFTDIDDFDITDFEQTEEIFRNFNPDYCINAAAYTNVDKAESEPLVAFKINELGVENLAELSKKYFVKLIHISTDYIYNSNTKKVNFENSNINPENQYARSKSAGEIKILEILSDFVIIRTSWLYSQYAHNFVKTILKLGDEKETINVINDQIGSPTYAGDLAKVIFEIVTTEKFVPGVYNFSDIGFISWYEFAVEIIKYSSLDCKINPISSSEYPTHAVRPTNSKMAKDKIISTYKINIPYWTDSLKKCISYLKI